MKKATWTDTQKEAWRNGALDRLSGLTRAYKMCQKRESTDKNCAAYCLGYRSSGTGE